MLIRLITWGFVIFLVYRFLARFLFPVVNITRMTSERLKQMQKQMEEMEQLNHGANTRSNSQVNNGDYIDYEEVK